MAEPNENNIIDLDDLQPQAKKVRFGGEVIEVPPPSTGSIMRIGKLSASFEGEDTAKMEETASQLEAEVRKCIPELGDKKLNTAQLMLLVSLLVDMGFPQDSKELRERGITADAPKADSAS